MVVCRLLEGYIMTRTCGSFFCIPFWGKNRMQRFKRLDTKKYGVSILDALAHRTPTAQISCKCGSGFGHLGGFAGRTCTQNAHRADFLQVRQRIWLFGRFCWTHLHTERPQSRFPASAAADWAIWAVLLDALAHRTPTEQISCKCGSVWAALTRALGCKESPNNGVRRLPRPHFAT